MLEWTGDKRQLALALSCQSQLYMLAARAQDSIACGQRAVALAREVGDPAITSHALTNIGTSQWQLEDPAGPATIEEGLRIALDAGDVEDACRAYVNIVWNLLDRYRLDEAERYLAAAVRLAEDAEFLGFLSYMHVERAMLEFSRGWWDAAVRSAELSVDTSLPVRCPAFTVIGRVAARRGQPEAAGLLWTAWDLAVKSGELQRTGPVAVRLGDQVHRAELGYWLAKAGQRVQPPGDHPYSIQAAGRWREAAAFWESAGCPYEQAMALAESRDPEPMLTALGMLDELAAKPLATRIRRRLRALGVARIPRGPLTETRVNPAGLTGRQVDVLRLLGQGFTNAQIAGQLVVSVRTVDSHVAAVLGKLGAASRQEAAARAAELGLLDARNQ